MRRRPDTSKTRLTEPVLRGLLPWSAVYSIGDTVQRGLRVRVTPGSVVSFVVAYNPRDGSPTRTFTIGQHPRVTLTAARNRAKEILAEVALRGDPHRDLIAVRQKHRDGHDLNALAAEFIRHRAWDLAPKTVELYRWFERTIKDARVGRMNLEEVTHADLDRLFGDFVELSGEVSTNRLFQFIRATFKWAAGRGVAAFPAGEFRERTSKGAFTRRTTEGNHCTLTQGTSTLLHVSCGSALTHMLDGTRIEFDLE